MTPPQHIVAAAGLIRNPQGQVLMVLSPKRGWECPGGQVEEGEDLLHALAREVHEETGVEIRIGGLIGVYSNLTPPPKVIFSFHGEWVAGHPTPSAESLKSEWVDRDSVLARVTHAAIYERIRDALAFEGQVIYRAYTLDPNYQLQMTRHLK